MHLTFEGHACFTVITSNSRQIIIDPYITDNPLCRKSLDDFAPDIILVTHAHHDHLGDAVELARRSGATLVAQADLLDTLDLRGISCIGMNIGGRVRVDGITVIMTQAIHGSTLPDGRSCGTACGFIIEDAGGNLFHAGDTALFGDMETVIRRYNPAVALLPIGDLFTMGPDDAITAAHWLKARYVIPMHYNTFPGIRQDVRDFKARLESRVQSKCIILEPGESWDYDLGKETDHDTPPRQDGR